MSPESENIQMEMQDNYDRKYPHKYKMEYIQNISMLKFSSFSFFFFVGLLLSTNIIKTLGKFVTMVTLLFKNIVINLKDFDS